MPPISRHDIDAMLDDAAAMTPVRHPYKPVYSGAGGRCRIGYARSWGEVAQLIGDTRPDAVARLSRENVEGPDGFFLKDKK